MKPTSLDILKTFWGFESFRPLQEDIINAVLDKKDTVVLLPTGGGKSLCFQVPGLSLDGITIVVSPLIALMKDQVLELQEKGIKAMALTSGIRFKDLDILLDNCIYGNYKFLYLSPERLQQELVIERIKQMNVSLIAIDEAHCISQWGHDFRPAYRNIDSLRRLKPEVPVIALTATATDVVLKDICLELNLINPEQFKSSYKRENLTYTVSEQTDKLFHLEQYLKQCQGSAIVYVRSRKATVNTAQFLKSRGLSAAFYHGGMPSSDRHKQYMAWRSNEIKVMVATNAFGMGINKGDVDYVIHLEIPDSLENYFQEAGRAGRNGQAAKAVLLFNENDEVRLDTQFLKVIPGLTEVKEVYKKLNSYFQISYGEGVETTHQFNFSTFCRTYSLHSMLTYNVLRLLDSNSLISLSQEFTKKATVQFKITDVALTYYLIKNATIAPIIQSILRTYGGIFDQVTSINTSTIATKAVTSTEAVHSALLILEKDDIINYEHKNFDTSITFLVPREDDRTIHTILPYIQTQAAHKKQQIQSVKDFLRNQQRCRSVQLLAYFGELDSVPCNQCDVCLKNKQQATFDEVYVQVKDYIALAPRSSKELSLLRFRESEIIKAIKLLLDQRIITITQENTYQKL